MRHGGWRAPGCEWKRERWGRGSRPLTKECWDDGGECHQKQRQPSFVLARVYGEVCGKRLQQVLLMSARLQSHQQGGASVQTGILETQDALTIFIFRSGTSTLETPSTTIYAVTAKWAANGE
jgi:hypothetical protein